MTTIDPSVCNTNATPSVDDDSGDQLVATSGSTSHRMDPAQALRAHLMRYEDCEKPQPVQCTFDVVDALQEDPTLVDYTAELLECAQRVINHSVLVSATRWLHDLDGVLAMSNHHPRLPEDHHLFQLRGGDGPAEDAVREIANVLAAAASAAFRRPPTAATAASMQAENARETVVALRTVWQRQQNIFRQADARGVQCDIRHIKTLRRLARADRKEAVHAIYGVAEQCDHVREIVRSIPPTLRSEGVDDEVLSLLAASFAGERYVGGGKRTHPAATPMPHQLSIDTKLRMGMEWALREGVNTELACERAMESLNSESRLESMLSPTASWYTPSYTPSLQELATKIHPPAHTQFHLGCDVRPLPIEERLQERVSKYFSRASLRGVQLAATVMHFVECNVLQPSFLRASVIRCALLRSAIDHESALCHDAPRWRAPSLSTSSPTGHPRITHGSALSVEDDADSDEEASVVPPAMSSASSTATLESTQVASMRSPSRANLLALRPTVLEPVLVLLATSSLLEPRSGRMDGSGGAYVSLPQLLDTSRTSLDGLFNASEQGRGRSFEQLCARVLKKLASSLKCGGLCGGACSLEYCNADTMRRRSVAVNGGRRGRTAAARLVLLSTGTQRSNWACVLVFLRKQLSCVAGGDEGIRAFECDWAVSSRQAKRGAARRVEQRRTQVNTV